MGQTATLYGQYVVTAIPGGLLSENQELEISLEGDDQDVFTIVRAWGGQTATAKKIMATFKSAIPASGIELDAWNLCMDSTIIEMKFQNIANGSTLTSSGFIRKPKISAGVNKSSEQSYEFHGGAANWQGG